MASVTKTTSTNSDLAFNKQADAARDALKNFNTISQLNAPGLIKTAMDELVASMVSVLLSFITGLADHNDGQSSFHGFVPHYAATPSFQELPAAAIDALNRFTVKNPTYKLPKSFPTLAGLVARAKDVSPSAVKKGEPSAPYLFLFFLLIVLLVYLAAIAANAASLRPDKKKGKVGPCFSLFLLTPHVYRFPASAHDCPKTPLTPTTRTLPSF